MNSKVAASCLAISVVLLVVLIGEIEVTSACNVWELNVCASAIQTNSKPSDACCGALRGQTKDCLCGYMKNPEVKKLINSPGAKTVAKTCRTSFPSCP
ncbi:hypothetical protein OROHE_023142 [Orobanche hederae]